MGYTNANYVGDLDKRRSTSHYVLRFTRGAMPWRSRLQDSKVLSTTKVEYVASFEACKEAIWLACLVGDLGILAETPIL